MDSESGNNNMKTYVKKLTAKIDSLTLRERVIIFTMLAVVALSIINNAVLDAQFTRQKQLSDQIKGQQAQIIQIQADIRQAVQPTDDPDKINQARLNDLRKQAVDLHASMSGLQKGLVAPEKMTYLLEEMLKRDGALKLVSLKTLPVSALGEKDAPPAKPGEVKPGPAASGAEKNAAATPRPGEIYRHGVEITVSGGYLDMLKYLSDLESMPWQLFWGKAQLGASEFPNATLTLTLYTLSLDKKWLNL